MCASTNLPNRLPPHVRDHALPLVVRRRQQHHTKKKMKFRWVTNFGPFIGPKNCDLIYCKCSYCYISCLQQKMFFPFLKNTLSI